MGYNSCRQPFLLPGDHVSHRCARAVNNEGRLFSCCLDLDGLDCECTAKAWEHQGVEGKCPFDAGVYRVNDSRKEEQVKYLLAWCKELKIDLPTKRHG